MKTFPISISYSFELIEEALENPDLIMAFPLTLPDGRRARFMRITEWENPSKENVSETSDLNQNLP